MDRWPQAEGRDGRLAPRPAKARCKACGEVWLALPEEAAIELDTPVADARPARQPSLPPARRRGVAVEPADAPEAPPARRRRWLPAVAVAATAAALGAAAIALWQPARVGLPAPLVALYLPEVRLPAVPWPALDIGRIRLPEPAVPALGVSADALVRPLAAGGAVWEVSGEVSNPGVARQPVPPLEVLIVANDGTPLARWTVAAGAASLAPGAAVAFETSALNPPPGAARVSVRLKPAALGRP